MAKLNVIRSNRLETLVDLMGERLRTQLPANPIAPIDVVVGSRGMERWLRHRLAMHFGICCNMHFPFPAMKFDALVTNILGESMVEREAWGGASLAFAILDVLPLLVERQEFEAVHGYLASWDAPVSAKAFGLAGQLAAMFERYIDYRPELACAWSRGAQKAAEDDSMHEWQRILWVEVQQRLERPHRAARVAAAIERLKAEQNSHREPLHLFGLTSLPPVWLALIEAYAHHGDVDIYLPCASDSAWQFLRDCIRKDRARWREMSRDTMAEALREEYRRSARPALHPLLLSMGRASRHFQIQLETFVDEENMTDQGRFEGFGRSALRRLQSDVLGATAPTERETLANTDDSLQFHACYGEIRQVEVLRDVLLGLLEDHRDLEPRDIVVLCPDIETLGPLITAVFSQGPSARHRKDGEPVQGADGWGPVGAPRIPFEVMDASIRRLNPVADALLRLLELAEGRFEASAVLDLLSLEPVHRRFSLDDKDLVMLREWVRSSGIRWGRDAADRKRHGQPLDSQNTWRFGLRRLLLGVVLADDGRMVAGREANGEPTNVLPFDDMEGASTAGLGKLVDFLNTLIEVTESLRRARPMTEWVSALEEALDRLTATSKAASWLTLRTRQAIRELGMDAGGSERLVTREAVTSALSRSMEVLSRATKEQCGAMVFGCLRPMRSVPYRVVCLLGMDDGKFPRKNEMLAFDRTAMAPRAADPSPCD
ncbi:MAG TPA: exodeoxyribonuclease V subunit gamma, partial [Polyangiaceae bacterium]|nr:exodeoxyribonuclease V subunit gamma [Polyangiaceae bacterium]